MDPSLQHIDRLAFIHKKAGRVRQLVHQLAMERCALLNSQVRQYQVRLAIHCLRYGAIRITRFEHTEALMSEQEAADSAGAFIADKQYGRTS